jgi:hypothetical protein
MISRLAIQIARRVIYRQGGHGCDTTWRFAALRLRLRRSHWHKEGVVIHGMHPTQLQLPHAIRIAKRVFNFRIATRVAARVLDFRIAIRVAARVLDFRIAIRVAARVLDFSTATRVTAQVVLVLH